MTAALYNGGALNVKRMLAGLMASLPETEKYMEKVPATRRDLDARVARVQSTPNESVPPTWRWPSGRATSTP